MELELKKQQIKYKKQVYSDKINLEKTQEVIVSDTLPDVFEIVDTFATAFLRGKDTSTGKVTVGGAVDVSVLFSADNGYKTRSVSTSIPFTATADSSEITDNCEITAKITVISAETKMINPRKALVRINLCVHVTCYTDTESEISNDIISNGHTECHIEETTVLITKNINEKTFTISDEFSVDTINKPSEILAYSVNLITEETKPIGNKLIVSGRASSKVIYLPEDSENVECAEFSTPFSQIVELTDIADEHHTDCELMLTGAYFSISEISGTGEKGIVSELHGVIQCETSQEEKIAFLSDIYSTKYTLTSNKEVFSGNSRKILQNIGASVQGTVPAAVAPEKIVSACFQLSDPHINNDGNCTKAVSTVTVKILYFGSDNQLRSAKANIDFDAALQCELEHNLFLTISSADEIYIAPIGINFEVRLPVSFGVYCNKNERFSYINSVTYDEKDILNKDSIPSITLYRTKEVDSIWSICKEHLTRKDIFIDANELVDGAEITENKLLIIPKCN